MTENYNDYIDDLYNEKLKSYKQEPFLVRYREFVINTGELIKKHYLTADSVTCSTLISSTDGLLDETYGVQVDFSEFDRVYNEWDIPRGSLNFGKHIIEYIKRTSGPEINIDDFYLDTFRQKEKKRPETVFRDSVFYDKSRTNLELLKIKEKETKKSKKKELTYAEGLNYVLLLVIALIIVLMFFK